MSPEVAEAGDKGQGGCSMGWGGGEGKQSSDRVRLGDPAVRVGFLPSTVESNRKGFVRGAARRDMVLFRDGAGSDVRSCHSPGGHSLSATVGCFLSCSGWLHSKATADSTL